MTIIYVDSAAVGTGTGVTWANAYTTLVAAFTGTAESSGDEFHVSHAHAETVAAALTSNLQASGGNNRGVRIRSMNKATDVAAFGAAFVMAANALSIYGVVEQCHFNNSGGANDLTIQIGNGTEFIGCKFAKLAANSFVLSTTVGTVGHFRFCEFACGTSYTAIFATGTGGAACRFDKCTLSGTKGSGPDLITQAGTHFLDARFYDSDLSQIDNIVDTASSSNPQPMHVLLSRCVLPSSFEVDDSLGPLGRKGSRVVLSGCKAGTVFTPVTDRAIYTHHGQAVMQSAKFRNNGATDGTTAHAWELTAYANRTWKQTRHAAETLESTIWIDAGTPATISVYLAHDGVGAGAIGELMDDEFWMTISGPSAAATATAEGHFVSTMRPLGDTPVALVTDVFSTWTGTSLGTKQKITVTYTPTISGPVTARLVFAPGAATNKIVYADAAFFLT